MNVPYTMVVVDGNASDAKSVTDLERGPTPLQPIRHYTWNINQSVKIQTFKVSTRSIDLTYVGMNTDEIGSPAKAPAPMLTTDLCVTFNLKRYLKT